MGISDLRPIIIAAPVRRSGTTLMQRLLCSAKDAVIYGESCANDFNLLINILNTKKFLFASGDWRLAQWRDVLKGEVNEWIADLMPDIDEYLIHFEAGIKSLLTFYPDFADKCGRSIWGMKLPEWHGPQLLQLMQTLPESKLIYIVREISDCVRSAKAIGMLGSLKDVEFFCNAYRQNRDFMENHWNSGRMLKIEFNALVSESLQLDYIQNFVGCSRIDVSVLDHKINTYVDKERYADTGLGYLTPIDLTPQEVDLITSICSKK